MPGEGEKIVRRGWVRKEEDGDGDGDRDGLDVGCNIPLALDARSTALLGIESVIQASWKMSSMVRCMFFSFAGGGGGWIEEGGWDVVKLAWRRGREG